MPTRMMKDLFTGEIKFIDENDIPGRFGISFNRLRELVECNPEEGLAKWRVNRYNNWGHLVAEVGNALPTNHTCVDGHQIYMSYIMWAFAHNGEWATNELDHIDRNRKNNKISNLRVATSSQNCMNRSYSKNTSGVPGVYWHINRKRWQARIKVNHKSFFLGTFIDFEDARQARYDAEDRYFGEFAARHSRPRVPMKNLFA
jgi:HNH endonuclease